MVELTVEQVQAAADACQSNILANKDTLTMKSARSMLEKHLGLDLGTLKPQKDLVAKAIDLVLARGAAPKAAEQSAHEGDEADADEEEGEEEVEQLSPPKRKRAKDSGKSAPKAKAKKQQPDAHADKRPNNKLEALKVICTKAGLRPSPNVYRQKDDAARIQALEAFLEKKGLSRHSTPAEIAAFKRGVEREKDLEGIDMSNIVGGRRGRRETAAKPVSYMVDFDSGSEADDTDDAAAQDSGSEASGASSVSDEAHHSSDASEQAASGADSDSAASPASSPSPAEPKGNCAKAGKQSNGAAKKAAVPVEEEDGDGDNANGAAAKDPPDSVPPAPAPKRRAIISDSDDD